MKNNIDKLITFIFISIFLSGCINLDPQPDPTRFFVLSSESEGSTKKIKVNDKVISIGLQNIELPKYLDSSKIVVRKNNNEITYSEFNRWSESLDISFNRVISSKLDNLLETKQVEIFPWSGNFKHDYFIKIKVSQFEGDSNGNIILIADWNIYKKSKSNMVKNGSTFYRKKSWDGSDISQLVKQMNIALNQLGDEIVESFQVKL